MKMQCIVCGNQKDNKEFKIKERQLNQGEVFDYFLCNHCGTLQIASIVKNVGNYYPKNYPAFKTREKAKDSVWKMCYKKIFVKTLLNAQLPLKCLQEILESEWKHMHCLVGTRLNLKSEILDVGCGAGNWLRQLRDCGFQRLTGIDLFTAPPKDIEEWKFFRGEIYSDDLGKYDCITMHHSFEHMEDPLAVLKRMRELLKNNGTGIIRIPIMESMAWDMYQEDWYQIDAPRHFYLYSVKAIKYLCKKANLKVVCVKCDSDPTQFYISNMYKNTSLDLRTIEKRLDKQHKTHVALTRKANAINKGDQAIFYVKKC